MKETLVKCFLKKKHVLLRNHIFLKKNPAKTYKKRTNTLKACRVKAKYKKKQSFVTLRNLPFIPKTQLESIERKNI